MSAPHIVLITCVKTKRDYPCAAKDLYKSTMFAKERAYAEASGRPWFILSAEHGLVAPDEWLSPYERYLPDTSAAYRAAWGPWVVARLELLAGELSGLTIETHASSTYIDALRPHLEASGATLIDPLRGLAMGARLAWYGERDSEPAIGSDDDARIIALLLDETAAVTPDEFLAAGNARFSQPGLYSWWVDEAGAATLTRGLAHPVERGLIYAGLAGATRWPSGQRSRNTLWLRITTMHLAGNHEFSTFRRTLGAVLAAAEGSSRVNEGRLSEWMREHLKVIAVPFEDRDELGRLETRVLNAIDPPLNLKGMAATPVRRQLKELRAVVTRNG